MVYLVHRPECSAQQNDMVLLRITPTATMYIYGEFVAGFRLESRCAFLGRFLGSRGSMTE
jgi:hypothetical protein